MPLLISFRISPRIVYSTNIHIEMDYDEDELDYNSQEELDQFDEDKLTNEEYDLLHQLLPQLKAKLKSYNDDVPEMALKEALYFNYFELEPSIEEIKTNFKSTYL